jgi:hypothetical protein
MRRRYHRRDDEEIMMPGFRLPRAMRYPLAHTVPSGPGA